jgi:hypothetical protein
VTFVGDSITHGGNYHSIVALFYATRFPDRSIRFYNCGIGGDRASMIMGDARYRLNVDILGYKPAATTVMPGMNDIGHADYRKVTNLERREQAVIRFQQRLFAHSTEATAA